MLQQALLDVVGRPLVDAVQVVEFVADAALKFRTEKAIKVQWSWLHEVAGHFCVQADESTMVIVFQNLVRLDRLGERVESECDSHLSV